MLSATLPSQDCHKKIMDDKVSDSALETEQCYHVHVNHYHQLHSLKTKEVIFITFVPV